MVSNLKYKNEYEKIGKLSIENINFYVISNRAKLAL